MRCSVSRLEFRGDREGEKAVILDIPDHTGFSKYGQSSDYKILIGRGLIHSRPTMECFENFYAGQRLQEVLREMAQRLGVVQQLLPKVPEPDLLVLFGKQLSSNVYQMAESSLRELQAALTFSCSWKGHQPKESLSRLYSVSMPEAEWTNIQKETIRSSGMKSPLKSFMSSSSRHSDGNVKPTIKSKTGKQTSNLISKLPQSMAIEPSKVMRTNFGYSIQGSQAILAKASRGGRSSRDNHDLKRHSSNNRNHTKNKRKALLTSNEKPKHLVSSLLSNILSPETKLMTSTFSAHRVDQSLSIGQLRDPSEKRVSKQQSIDQVSVRSQFRAGGIMKDTAKPGALIADTANVFSTISPFHELAQNKARLINSLNSRKQSSSAFSSHKGNFAKSRNGTPRHLQDGKRRSKLQASVLGSMVNQPGAVSVLMQRASRSFYEILTPGAGNKSKDKHESTKKSVSLATSQDDSAVRQSLRQADKREAMRPAVSDRLLEGCSLAYSNRSKQDGANLKKALDAIRVGSREASGIVSFRYDPKKASGYSKRGPMFA